MGWKGVVPEIPKGIIGMMHEGDQQLLNPYGKPNAEWAIYSFRPVDAEQQRPLISITPASFESLGSMKTMLNNIPYVVVKEYFFKNTASTVVNLLKELMDKATEALEGVKNDMAGANEQQDAASQGSGDAKSVGTKLMDKIKDKFQNINLKPAAISIPFILYTGLRQKLYGNTYIFPYIVNSGTIINSSNNSPEWNGKGSLLGNFIKGGISQVANLLAGAASFLSGSDAQAANLFPAPVWGGPGDGEKPQFSMEIVLINDNVVKARNNYMCVNTIINNNRSIQKAILAFPGALYELWLPTGQRHLMCTAKLELYPLGLNRQVPTNFFKGGSAPGAESAANFSIGTSDGATAMIMNPHNEKAEVIPDAYKLKIDFQSCLSNNLNTSVFQYYVKMTGYDSYGTDAPGS